MSLADTPISDSAADAVRLKFNPSDLTDVSVLKHCTASLISMMEVIRDRNDKFAAREAAIAITNLQTTSMWCVLAATKGL